MPHDGTSPYQERWDRVRRQRYEREERQRQEQAREHQQQQRSDNSSIDDIAALFAKGIRPSPAGPPRRQITANSGSKSTRPTPTQSRSYSQPSIR